MNINISIIIRTYNSEKTLGVVLDALTLIHGDEIIVVDSGSDDLTLQIANQYKAKIIHAPRPFHYSKSLNIGFAAAENPWVLVLSSHSIPQKNNFLDCYRGEIIKFPKDVIVGYGPSTLSGKALLDLEDKKTTYYSCETFHKIVGICGNANTIYRLSAWIELPFDESIRTSEDKIWISEMISRKYRLAYIPFVQTLNQNKGSLIYMFKKGYRDKRTLRDKDFKPMRLYHVVGGFKNLTQSYIRRDIDFGNYIRWTSQLLGQYFGSHQTEDNSPKNGGS